MTARLACPRVAAAFWSTALRWRRSSLGALPRLRAWGAWPRVPIGRAWLAARLCASPPASCRWGPHRQHNHGRPPCPCSAGNPSRPLPQPRQWRPSPTRPGTRTGAPAWTCRARPQNRCDASWPRGGCQPCHSPQWAHCQVCVWCIHPRRSPIRGVNAAKRSEGFEAYVCVPT